MLGDIFLTVERNSFFEKFFFRFSKRVDKCEECFISNSKSVMKAQEQIANR